MYCFDQSQLELHFTNLDENSFISRVFTKIISKIISNTVIIYKQKKSVLQMFVLRSSIAN